MVLATFIAINNIVGVAAAIIRKRHGSDKGYSTVAVVSLLLSIAAWWFGGSTIGLWAFVPAMIDPGTWSLVLLPLYLLFAYRKDTKDKLR